MLQGEHFAILLTFLKLPFVIKIFVLSIFEWLFYTGFAVFIWVSSSDFSTYRVGLSQSLNMHGKLSGEAMDINIGLAPRL